MRMDFIRHCTVRIVFPDLISRCFVTGICMVSAANPKMGGLHILAGNRMAIWFWNLLWIGW